MSMILPVLDCTAIATPTWQCLLCWKVTISSNWTWSPLILPSRISAVSLRGEPPHLSRDRQLVDSDDRGSPAQRHPGTKQLEDNLVDIRTVQAIRRLEGLRAEPLPALLALVARHGAKVVARRSAVPSLGVPPPRCSFLVVVLAGRVGASRWSRVHVSNTRFVLPHTQSDLAFSCQNSVAG